MKTYILKNRLEIIGQKNKISKPENIIFTFKKKKCPKINVELLFYLLVEINSILINVFI